MNLLHVRTAHIICYGCGIQAWLVYLTHTIPPYCHLLELAAVSKAIPTSKVSPWGEFLADSGA